MTRIHRVFAVAAIACISVSGGAALAIAEPLPSPTSTSPPPVSGECVGFRCDLVAEDGVERQDTAIPLDEEPTNPGAATTAAIAQAYEDAGLDRCPFWGMGSDDEADPAIDHNLRNCREGLEVPEGLDVPSYEEIVAYVASQYVQLPIAPSPINHQPATDWALINIDFIVYTDPAPQVFDVELLGYDVTFRATPVHWTWDFGDDSTPLQTSSPGHPYPNQDVAHVYTDTHDAVTISVTTQWQGAFQINGTGPWHPVSTHAVTTATTGPIEILAVDVNLVPNP